MTPSAARAYYQLGVHHFEREDLVAARSAYIEALLLVPSDTDAKLNLEIVNTLLAAPRSPARRRRRAERL